MCACYMVDTLLCSMIVNAKMKTKQDVIPNAMLNGCDYAKRWVSISALWEYENESG